MKVIGLTGGIGCGKSAVMRVLVGLGAEGIDADRVAHEVMAPRAAAYAPVVAEFGQGILAPDGTIDRGALGQRVFDDPAALARLEGIVHPAVAGEVRRRVAGSHAPVVVIEAIKLLEAGLSRALCDEIWVVGCSPETQVARLAATRGMPATEVERRRSAQMPHEQMAAQAQRVINTDGTLAEMALQALVGWAESDIPLPVPLIRPATAKDAPGIAALLKSIIREGGRTVLDHPFTPDETKDYLAGLAPRERITVAQIGGVIAAEQSLDLYVKYTGAMDHVGVLGTFVLAPLRGRGFGRALADATFAFARANGYRKFVINIRADNPDAQAYYQRLGFQPCGRLAEQARVDNHYVDELLYERFLEER